MDGPGENDPDLVPAFHPRFCEAIKTDMPAYTALFTRTFQNKTFHVYRVKKKRKKSPKSSEPGTAQQQDWEEPAARGREEGTESQLLVYLCCKPCPAEIISIIFWTQGSVDRGGRAAGRFELQAALFWLVVCRRTYRGAWGSRVCPPTLRCCGWTSTDNYEASTQQPWATISRQSYLHSAMKGKRLLRHLLKIQSLLFQNLWLLWVSSSSQTKCSSSSEL